MPGAVVIGGGVVGVATLHHLARKGWADSVLLERKELTSGSTWHAAGLLPLFDMSYSVGQIHKYSVNLYGQLESCPDACLLPRSTVSGLYDHNFVTAAERRTDAPRARQRLHRVRAEQVVPATGAIERPLVFANNDLPGVMLAASVHAYLHRYAVAPGDRLVLLTNDHA